MAKPGPSLCPDCYLTQGIDTPLISRQGSTIRCEVGHSWPGNDQFSDMEILQQRQDMARHKRAQMALKENPELAEPVKTVPATVQAAEMDIVVGRENVARITDIIGEFSDASSLYGGIYSLAQDLKTAKEELNLARKSLSPAATKELNPTMQVLASGDMPITVLVPERYVQPLKDISEANAAEVPDYMQNIITSGFENGWFF